MKQHTTFGIIPSSEGHEAPTFDYIHQTNAADSSSPPAIALDDEGWVSMQSSAHDENDVNDDQSLTPTAKSSQKQHQKRDKKAARSAKLSDNKKIAPPISSEIGCEVPDAGPSNQENRACNRFGGLGFDGDEDSEEESRESCSLDMLPPSNQDNFISLTTSKRQIYRSGSKFGGLSFYDEEPDVDEEKNVLQSVELLSHSKQDTKIGFTSQLDSGGKNFGGLVFDEQSSEGDEVFLSDSIPPIAKSSRGIQLHDGHGHSLKKGDELEGDAEMHSMELLPKFNQSTRNLRSIPKDRSGKGFGGLGFEGESEDENDGEEDHHMELISPLNNIRTHKRPHEGMNEDMHTEDMQQARKRKIKEAMNEFRSSTAGPIVGSRKPDDGRHSKSFSPSAVSLDDFLNGEMTDDNDDDIPLVYTGKRTNRTVASSNKPPFSFDVDSRGESDIQFPPSTFSDFEFQRANEEANNHSVQDLPQLTPRFSGEEKSVCPLCHPLITSYLGTPMANRIASKSWTYMMLRRPKV